MTKMYVKRKPIKCPKCGHRPVAKYVYGMFIYSDEQKKELEAGKIAIGGCCIMPDNPKWFCSNCETDFHKEGVDLLDF